MKLVIVFLAIALASVFANPIGKNQHHLDGRIIGGQVARAGQFPFAAAIYYRTSSGTYFCAGSLIANQWVLTAGRCVLNALSFTLHFGKNQLDDANGVVVSTSEYTIHPFFDPETFIGDVGVIKLRIPIDYSDYIQPIYLPGHALEDGDAVVSIGWGQISDDDAGLTNDLYYVTVATMPNDDCQNFYTTTITEDMVCIEGNNNEGTCNGDLGGPLVRYQPRAPTLIVGISSFVGPFGCESLEPSGYTRSYPYVAWIRETMTSG